MKRYFGVFALTLLAVPATSFAASKEQMEMQRDIAQLQDQVRMLQSAFDQRMAALQTLMEQAVKAGNDANVSVGVLSSNVVQTLDRELKSALTPVAGVSARVENINNDVAELKNAVQDLNAALNRQQQLLTDINNQIKVLQAPPAAPPPTGVAGAPSGPPPSAKVLMDGAFADYSSGKADLALDEYTQFLKFYPDDPNAPQAQFMVGQIHSSQNKYDVAVMDFDNVLERYPENKYTVDAMFLKGIALKESGRRDLAVQEFRGLISKYPRSDRAKEANEQLRALRVGTGTTDSSSAARRKKTQ